MERSHPSNKTSPSDFPVLPHRFEESNTSALQTVSRQGSCACSHAAQGDRDARSARSCALQVPRLRTERGSAHAPSPRERDPAWPHQSVQRGRERRPEGRGRLGFMLTRKPFHATPDARHPRSALPHQGRVKGERGRAHPLPGGNGSPAEPVSMRRGVWARLATESPSDSGGSCPSAPSQLARPLLQGDVTLPAACLPSTLCLGARIRPRSIRRCH